MALLVSASVANRGGKDARGGVNCRPVASASKVHRSTRVSALRGMFLPQPTRAHKSRGGLLTRAARLCGQAHAEMLRSLALVKSPAAAARPVAQQQQRTFATNPKSVCPQWLDKAANSRRRRRRVCSDIKKRIKGTTSIRKITKSMKMVSAAKLRGDQTRLANGAPFGRSARPFLPALYSIEDASPPEVTAKKGMVAVVSTDKGLCGGINTFSTRMTKLVLDQHEKKGDAGVGLYIYGMKSEGQLRRTHGKYVKGSIDECWKQPMNFAEASGMSSALLAAVKEGGYDEVSLVFNTFKSMIKYLTVVQRVPNFETLLAKQEAGGLPAPLDKYELEPDSSTEAVQNFFEWTMATTLYGACIDNACAEQSSRVQSMDGSTKNAGEMIDKLLLEYNRARQSKITTELIEIISGAESLKG